MSRDYPPAFLKHPHAAGCDGNLFRPYGGNVIVHVDRTGRVGNGGIVTHDYRCNRHWAGCKARVLVTEHAIQRIAVAVEVRKAR